MEPEALAGLCDLFLVETIESHNPESYDNHTSVSIPRAWPFGTVGFFQEA